MLSPFRVLDLSDERGMLCGQILADLGADVIQVEPPGGSPVRSRPPFLHDTPDPEGSLVWWALARNKRSVELDLETEPGRDALRRLVEQSDVLIESFPAGSPAAAGLTATTLARWNPRLVHVSITAFGRSGPKSAYADSDLVVMAASGALYLTGDSDRPPIRVSVPQAFAHACSDAAVGALIALHERRRSGLGQHVDVSAQQAATAANMFAGLDAAWGDRPRRRAATARRVGELEVRTHFQARDGWVVTVPGFATPLAPFMTRLIRWAHEVGLCDESYLARDWAQYGRDLIGGRIGPDEHARLTEILESLFGRHSKAELLEAAVLRRLLVAPVLEIPEVLDTPQLQARSFAFPVRIPQVPDPVRFPGPFARFSRTPLSNRYPPPRRGEHRLEDLLGERAAAPASSPSSSGGPPLAGTRVLDLFWVLAGPGATRTLADYGAEVVHVESSRRRDTLRSVGPHLDGHAGAERSGAFQCANAGKRLLALDLARPEGREVLLDLVRWADVVTESFSPGVLDAWGLGYERLRRVKEDVILISSCLMGQTGPLRSFAGYGSLAASVTGFQTLAAWPDRAPAGPFGAYTDYLAVRYNAIAILAALEHRARTGEGQWIDMSQAEAALHFLTPALLDAQVNGRAAGPAGNRDPYLAPHGVYPARGDDRWVAVAVRDDAEWAALCDEMGRADLAGDPALAAASGRVAAAERLDAELADWTRELEAETVERRLQARGVAAHAVLDPAALAADPQLAHRGHFFEIEHPLGGRLPIEASRFRLSRSRELRPEHAVSYGCDGDYVLRTLLGYDDARIAALEAADVLV